MSRGRYWSGSGASIRRSGSSAPSLVGEVSSCFTPSKVVERVVQARHPTSAQEMTVAHHSGHSAMTSEMRQCIQECLDCHSSCLDTARHCLEMGGQHAAAKHVTLLLDCADICQTSANFMLRHSDRHARTCELCATVCRECEKACRSFHQDPEMQHAAE